MRRSGSRAAHVVVTLGLATVLSSVAHAHAHAHAHAPLRKLSGSEIANRLTDMELTDEVRWSYVFQKGGRLTSVALGIRRSGTWRVRDNELCLDSGPDGHRCFKVWNTGQRVELCREGTLPDEAILQKPQARR